MRSEPSRRVRISGSDETEQIGLDLRTALGSLEDRAKALQQLASEQAKDLQRLYARCNVEDSDEPRRREVSAASISITSSVDSEGQPRAAREVTMDSTETNCKVPSILQKWITTKADKRSSRLSGRSDRSESHFSLPISADSARMSRVASERGCADRIDKLGSRIVLSPVGKLKMAWDLLSVSVVSADVVMLPLLAFGVDSASVMWFSRVFWSFDFVLSFGFGFYDKDCNIETRLSHTARRYLRTWCAVDFTILLLDWAILLFALKLDELASLGRMNRMARAIRLMKILRFTRMVRGYKFLNSFRQMCQNIVSVNLLLFGQLFVLLTAASIIIHYIACAWYAIGDATFSTEDSWVRGWKEQQIGNGYFYLISYHWAMAQFLPAPVREHPKNVSERLFTIIVLFTGFVLFSSFLGSVTALVTENRRSVSARISEGYRLREFFTSNQIRPILISRVLDFQRRSAQEQKSTITMKDLPCLQKLPMSLRCDILHELHFSTLSSCPFFDALDGLCAVVVKDVCDRSVADVVVASEIVFESGSTASSMRFIKSGGLAYRAEVIMEIPTGESNYEVGKAVQITRARYLSEAALWLAWVHQGRAEAETKTEILSVNSEAFHLAVKQYPSIGRKCFQYAVQLHGRMSHAGSSGQSIDDTFQAFDTVQEMNDALPEFFPQLGGTSRTMEAIWTMEAVSEAVPCASPMENEPSTDFCV